MLKSLILLFVHLISLCCPVLFQARPIDSLNRTSYYNYEQQLTLLLLTPRRACAARVTVVVLYVCMCVYLSVCLSAHAILAVRAIKSITKDTIVLSIRFAAILKWRFFNIVLFES